MIRNFILLVLVCLTEKILGDALQVGLIITEEIVQNKFISISSVISVVAALPAPAETILESSQSEYIALS